MNHPLDITGEDIAKLNDGDLRNLVGRLCEADFRCGGLYTACVTWDGSQDAKDGGVDVLVDAHVDPPKSSNIPRKKTIYRVKKPDMARKKILDEMRLKGALRKEIYDLIPDSGAYVIVSSQASTTALALKVC